VRYIESLLYEVKPTDPSIVALPSVTILLARIGANARIFLFSAAGSTETMCVTLTRNLRPR